MKNHISKRASFVIAILFVSACEPTPSGGGTVTPNPSALTKCLSDIDALSCSGSEEGSAWHSSSPLDFSGVASMIPTSTAGGCADVY